MNPYDYNIPHANPYMNMQNFRQPQQQPQGQTIQPLTQQVSQQIFTYFVKSAEQLNTIQPAPNTIYLGFNEDKDQIYIRRMNNDGITEVKTYTLAGEQKKKNDLQIILEEIHGIKKHLKIGKQNESNGNS